MTNSAETPKIPIKSFKRTKIIASLGQNEATYERVLALIKSGANGLKLTNHYDNKEEAQLQVAWIRKASKFCGKHVAIIQDLVGPRLELGHFDGIINVQKGETLTFMYQAVYQPGGLIPLGYDFSSKVKRGQRLYLTQGRLRTKIAAIKDKVIFAVAENNGILIKSSKINLPDTDFGGDVITAKDRRDLMLGTSCGVDYVSLGYIQSAGDVDSLRRMLKNIGSGAKIIAKIDSKSSVDNMEAIISATDVVMVSCSDLAVETEFESLPVAQRTIINQAQKYAKPSIVATHMFTSMSETPLPTRAEVSEVAAAVMAGADCVMLSDETANGQYPVQAVSVMKRVIRYTESHSEDGTILTEPLDNSRQSHICSSVIILANNIDARAIVAETRSGATARQIAARRSQLTVLAVTPDSQVAQQLAIVYGVKGYVRPIDRYAANKLTTWLRSNKVLNKSDVIIVVSGQYPGVVGSTDTIKVRVLE